MSRVQLALNVDDLDVAITFYSKLFGTEPAKVKPGYANFAIADPPLKLVLLENPGQGGSLNHLGVEVDSSATVHAEIARLTDAGMFTEEEIVPGFIKRTMVNRSSFRVNLDQFTGSPGLDVNDVTKDPVAPNSKECLTKTDMIYDDSARK